MAKQFQSCKSVCGWVTKPHTWLLRMAYGMARISIGLKTLPTVLSRLLMRTADAWIRHRVWSGLVFSNGGTCFLLPLCCALATHLNLQRFIQMTSVWVSDGLTTFSTFWSLVSFVLAHGFVTTIGFLSLMSAVHLLAGVVLYKILINEVGIYQKKKKFNLFFNTLNIFLLHNNIIYSYFFNLLISHTYLAYINAQI